MSSRQLEPDASSWALYASACFDTKI